MYLSRLILNPRSFQVLKDLADIQEMHRTIFRGFPHFEKSPVSGTRKDHRILYRVEMDHQLPKVLVQSVIEPDWSALQEAGVLLKTSHGNNPAIKEISGAYDGLKEGQVLAFRLRANPTKRLSTQSEGEAPKSIGPRLFLRTEDEQTEWLQRKAREGGFSLLTTLFSGEPDLRTLQEAPIKGHRGDKTISFGSVLFEGRLKIVNRDKFLKTLWGGIGSAKGYGFGLLSIARG